MLIGCDVCQQCLQDVTNSLLRCLFWAHQRAPVMRLVTLLADGLARHQHAIPSKGILGRETTRGRPLCPAAVFGIASRRSGYALCDVQELSPFR